MTGPNLEQIAAGYEQILSGLGLFWNTDPHMQDTPKRAAKAMALELCSSLSSEPPKMTTFPLEGPSEMVVSRGIPVRSLCAHHLLPFVGEATVAYIPDQKVLGLSKLSRAVEWISRQPQVQETLTTGIADFLVNVLMTDPEGDLKGGYDYPPGFGVGVVVRATHSCMTLRGVTQHSSDVVTSALRGEFLKPEVRAEFLSLAGVR